MARAANISPETRALVLDLYGSTCQLCARGPGDPDRLHPERRTRLVVGPSDDSGAPGEALCNLRVLCTACDARPPFEAASPGLVVLMGLLRRATVSDQRRALGWLRQRLGSERD